MKSNRELKYNITDSDGQVLLRLTEEELRIALLKLSYSYNDDIYFDSVFSIYGD